MASASKRCAGERSSCTGAAACRNGGAEPPAQLLIACEACMSYKGLGGEIYSSSDADRSVGAADKSVHAMSVLLVAKGGHGVNAGCAPGGEEAGGERGGEQDDDGKSGRRGVVRLHAEEEGFDPVRGLAGGQPADRESYGGEG